MELTGVDKLVKKTNEILSLFNLGIEFDEDYDSLEAYNKNSLEALESVKSTKIKVETEDEYEYRRRKRFIVPDSRVLNVDIRCIEQNLKSIHSEVVNDDYSLEFCVRNWDFKNPTRNEFVYPELPESTLKYIDKKKKALYSFELSGNYISTKVPNEANQNLLIGNLLINFDPVIFVSLDGLYVANFDQNGNVVGYTKYECNSMDDLKANLQVWTYGILDKIKGFNDLPNEAKLFIKTFLFMQIDELIANLDKDKLEEKIDAYITDIHNEAHDRTVAAEDVFFGEVRRIESDKAKAFQKVNDLKRSIGLE